MKKTILILSVIFFAGCGSAKKVYFKTDTYISKGIKEKFEIIIPKHYINVSSNIGNNLLKKWMYKDESYLYISLNISFADSPNVKNWMKCSNTKIKCTEGVDEMEKYWKELIIDNLVVGYKDIPKERKEEFDKAILSLKRNP